eukprot:7215918-Prymnesium_polylepis.2
MGALIGILGQQLGCGDQADERARGAQEHAIGAAPRARRRRVLGVRHPRLPRAAGARPPQERPGPHPT